MSWVDLDKLRHEIAARAKEIAEYRGLENVHVHVRIEDRDARGRRQIHVEVVPLDVRQVEAIQGRRWQDN